MLTLFSSLPRVWCFGMPPRCSYLHVKTPADVLLTTSADVLCVAGIDACAMELTLRRLVLGLADRFGRKRRIWHCEELLSVFGLHGVVLFAEDAL